MGYYVTIANSTWRVKADKLTEAYAAMCRLNTTHDHVKRGGSWGPGGQTAKWFSWMSADYPSECPDAKAVLEMLGFECEYDRVQVEGDRADKIKKLRAKAQATTNKHEAFAYHEKADELEAQPADAPALIDGDLLLVSYDSKIGQEDLFLEAIAPFSEGYIEWVGEDGDRWRNVVSDGRVLHQAAKITYE